MKRILPFMLAALLLLASCGEAAADTSSAAGTTAADVGGTAPETEAVPAETERYQTKDSLPDDLDFDGQTIVFLHRDDGDYLTIEVDCESTGEVITEAIHQRTLTVEERLNVDITTTSVASTIHAGDPVQDLVKRSVTAGSNDYDAAFNHMSNMTSPARRGMFLNVRSLPYLDLDQPWWSAFMDTATLYGKTYHLAGDVTQSMIESMYLIFYNKAFYESYFEDNLYDTVWDGGWTIDALKAMAQTVYTDVNGDGAQDEGDIYGYSTTYIRLIDALLVGCDIQLADVDSDGMPYFVCESNERTYTFIDKIHSLITDPVLTWHTIDSADGETKMLQKFAGGTILFIPFTPMGASQLREMEDDFGVVPMPKLDESQQEYTTCAHNGFSTMSLLTTTQCADALAATIEAMAAESYRYVTPAYYETALKVKYSRDDETSQMLDMIRDSITFDFGYVYNGTLGEPMTQFRSLVKTGGDAAASSLAKNMTACNKKLEGLLDDYAALS